MLLVESNATLQSITEIEKEWPLERLVCLESLESFLVTADPNQPFGIIFCRAFFFFFVGLGEVSGE
jgi:hypothetical protein